MFSIRKKTEVKSFNSLIEQGYILEYSDGQTPLETIINDPEVPNIDKIYKHQFCGQNFFVNAICPNCKKPLLQFFVFDLADERVGIVDSSYPKIPLLFCWTCELSQSPFFYQLEDKEQITILRYNEGEAYADFPYDNYPIFFPAAFVFLSPLTKKEQQLITSVNLQETSISRMRVQEPDLFGCRHQLGGEPFLIQRNPEYQLSEPLVCPLCNSIMPFFAAVADDCLLPEGFTGNVGVQVLFHICSKCYVLCAINRCD